MKDRTRRLLMLTVIMCIICLSLCACENGADASTEEQKGVQGNSNEEIYNNDEIKKMPSKEEQEQINRALKKMKEDGILDENGQPKPGVDLNDYPGLG